MVQATNVRVLNILTNGQGPISVAGEDAVAYSKSFVLPCQATFAVECQAQTSETTVSVKVQLEQSNYDATEEYDDDANFEVPIDAPEIFDDLSDELVNIKAYAPASTKFARFVLTGLAGNSEDVVITRLNISHVQ